MSKIKIAIVGVGNCASSLIQGIYYYADKSEKDAIGLRKDFARQDEELVGLQRAAAKPQPYRIELKLVTP